MKRYTLTLQNDDYIDFDEYWDDIMDASEYMLEYGSLTSDQSDEIIVVNSYGKTSITLEAGYSYLIQNANVLETVDIDFPEDENGNEIYDFFDNPYPETTIINFDGATVNPTTIDGKLVSQFPETLINGEVLDALSGDGGEYSEIGNKIIWNLPNVVTNGESNRLVFSTVGPNVAGHIVAPYAELWNYYESSSGVVTWGGGNLNGTAIVADFHGGYMEMHMWAFSGLEEISTAVSLTAEKIYTNGNLANQSFDFILEQVDGGDYDGLSDTFAFPYTATSDSSGMIRFPAIVFDVDSSIDYPKEYEFTIKEVIPATPRTDITYDAGEYLVTVTVYETTTTVVDMTYVTLSNDYTITQEGVYVNDMTFTNVKQVEEGGTTSYNFTKISEDGNALNGAQFVLSTDPENWTDAITYVSGYVTLDDGSISEYVILETDAEGDTEEVAEASTTTVEVGSITFENLELNTTYYFKEISAPTGYDVAEGYWMLEVNAAGGIFITAMDGAPEIENHQIINYPTPIEKIDVTLYKQTHTGNTLAGAVFIVERVLSLENPVVVEGGYHGEFTSNENGELLITDLLYDGVYRITETIAPDGYMIPEEIAYWLLDVHKDGSVEIYEPNLYEVGSNGDQTLVEGLILINTRDYVLPTTGGEGKWKYLFVGCLIMICVSLYCCCLQLRRKKGALQ